MNADIREMIDRRVLRSVRMFGETDTAVVGAIIAEFFPGLTLEENRRVVADWSDVPSDREE